MVGKMPNAAPVFNASPGSSHSCCMRPLPNPRFNSVVERIDGSDQLSSEAVHHPKSSPCDDRDSAVFFCKLPFDADLYLAHSTAWQSGKCSAERQHGRHNSNPCRGHPDAASAHQPSIISAHADSKPILPVPCAHIEMCACPDPGTSNRSCLQPSPAHQLSANCKQKWKHGMKQKVSRRTHLDYYYKREKKPILSTSPKCSFVRWRGTLSRSLVPQLSSWDQKPPSPTIAPDLRIASQRSCSKHATVKFHALCCLPNYGIYGDPSKACPAASGVKRGCRTQQCAASAPLRFGRRGEGL